jgi:hypothetical protein
MDPQFALIALKAAVQMSVATMCLVALCALASLAGDQPFRRR